MAAAVKFKYVIFYTLNTSFFHTYLEKRKCIISYFRIHSEVFPRNCRVLLPELSAAFK